MENNRNISKKTIKNAESTYFLLLINIAFFFSRDKELNHPFVKAHTKTAIFIHFLFLLTYIVFIHFSFLSFQISGFFLNKILAAIISLGLLGFLLLGMYKAGKEKKFGVGEIVHIAKKEKILDINEDKNLDEKDKLSLIMSYIPFLGIFIAGKYSENEQVKNSATFNLLASFIILSSFLSGHREVASIFLLFYTVFIVFSAMMIFSQNTIIHINTLNLGDIKKHYNTLKDSFSYIGNYFNKEKFIHFNELEKKKNEIRKNEEQELIKKLEKKEKFPWFDSIIYLPVINIIMLSKLGTQKNIQITNALGISIIFICILLIPSFNNAYVFLLLFPICYGLAFGKRNLAYKLPFFFDIGNICIKVFGKIFHIFRKAKKINETEKKVRLKVEEEKKEEK